MQVATIPPLAQTRRLDFAAAGGAKNHNGVHNFLIQYWMYEATRGQTRNGGTDFKWGGGTTVPSLAAALP